MRPERHQWNLRSGAASQQWLAGLIAATQQAERPEARRQPVSPEIVAGLQAQLALTSGCRVTPFSTLRH